MKMTIEERKDSIKYAIISLIVALCALTFDTHAQNDLLKFKYKFGADWTYMETDEYGYDYYIYMPINDNVKYMYRKQNDNGIHSQMITYINRYKGDYKEIKKNFKRSHGTPEMTYKNEYNTTFYTYMSGTSTILLSGLSPTGEFFVLYIYHKPINIHTDE